MLALAVTLVAGAVAFVCVGRMLSAGPVPGNSFPSTSSERAPSAEMPPRKSAVNANQQRFPENAHVDVHVLTHAVLQVLDHATVGRVYRLGKLVAQLQELVVNHGGYSRKLELATREFERGRWVFDAVATGW